MSTKHTSSGRPAARKKKQGTDLASILIPVVVGVVVLALVVFAIFSIENRQPVAIAAPVTTAQPQATQSVPYPDVPRISLDEARRKLDSGEAILVDVRTKESYDSSHAQGALSIPEAEIDSRLSEIPHDGDVILYCT
jgi:flagellar basal body-associated protein FliL